MANCLLHELWIIKKVDYRSFLLHLIEMMFVLCFFLGFNAVELFETVTFMFRKISPMNRTCREHDFKPIQ